MTMFGMTLSAIAIWIILLVLFLIVEALTMGLTTIWFAAGSLAGLIAAGLEAPVWLQVGLFLGVSCLLLVFTRRIFVEKMKLGKEKTNVESMVGRKGKVTEEIRPLEPGTVLLWGTPWTAIGEDEEATILPGTEVEVVEVRGVKAVVRPLKTL